MKGARADAFLFCYFTSGATCFSRLGPPVTPNS